MCCHTQVEVADQTCYLIQSQYTNTWPTSPITPHEYQHQVTRPGKAGSYRQICHSGGGRYAASMRSRTDVRFQGASKVRMLGSSRRHLSMWTTYTKCLTWLSYPKPRFKVSVKLTFAGGARSDLNRIGSGQEQHDPIMTMFMEDIQAISSPKLLYFHKQQT